MTINSLGWKYCIYGANNSCDCHTIISPRNISRLLLLRSFNEITEAFLQNNCNFFLNAVSTRGVFNLSICVLDSFIKIAL